MQGVGGLQRASELEKEPRRPAPLALRLALAHLAELGKEHRCPGSQPLPCSRSLSPPAAGEGAQASLVPTSCHWGAAPPHPTPPPGLALPLTLSPHLDEWQVSIMGGWSWLGWAPQHGGGGADAPGGGWGQWGVEGIELGLGLRERGLGLRGIHCGSPQAGIKPPGRAGTCPRGSPGALRSFSWVRSSWICSR